MKESQSSLSSDTVLDVENLQEFHDPFSDVNLFLSKRVRSFIEIHQLLGSKWSYKIQEDLLRVLEAPFQGNFPRFRLSISALKKIWEKVSFYLEHLEQHSDLFLSEALNIDYLISENLKESLDLRVSFPAHPFYLAHQIATRIAELLAVLEGQRVHIDRLAKKIWQLQRHVISSYKQCKSPQNDTDKIDKLIIKILLETSAKEPLISCEDLKNQTLSALLSLKDLPSLTSAQNLHTAVCALLSEKLYEISPLHSLLTTHQKKALQNFIQRHSKWLQLSHTSLSLENRVRRILSLHTLATQLPKNLSEEEVLEAIKSCYPLAEGDKPDLPQPLYAFIAAEAVLMRSHKFCHAQEHVANLIIDAYQEAIQLPVLQIHTVEHFEVFIWKQISDSENLLNKLPYKVGQRIDIEVANAVIDNPHACFSTIVTQTLKFFQRTQELTEHSDPKELEEKVHQWAIQSDMLLHYLNLDTESTLVQEIRQVFEEKRGLISHAAIVNVASQRYLKRYPELSMYAPRLSLRIWTLYKHLWYTEFCPSHESALERFFIWHFQHLKMTHPEMSKLQVESQWKQICQKRLTAIPSTFLQQWWQSAFSQTQK